MDIAPSVLGWLLEPEQPAVRRATLVDLLGRPESDPEVRKAQTALTRRGWAREILKRQRPGGYWEAREDLYRPKYVATIWRFIVLSDLGVTADDPRMRRTGQLFLDEYSRKDGGFDTPGSRWPRSELCLTGNLARTLVRCGFADDSCVGSAFEWLVRNQMEDGGWHCFYEKAFGRGTIDAWEGLYAYAFLPPACWTPRIRQSAERGAEFFLERSLLHQGKRYIPWTRTHYPVHYYYDFLVGLDMLTRLGYGGDRRLRPALQLLKGKQRRDGTWVLEAVHPDLGMGAGYRIPRNKIHRFALEEVGRPSKWITLTALQVLKRVEDAGAS